MRVLGFIALAALAAAPALAQQTGDANRDYVVNGGGAGGTSPISSAVGVPSLLDQAYATSDPNAPVFWLASSAVNPGQFLTSVNSVDLGTAPAFNDVVVFGQGTDPGAAGQFFTTDAFGNWNLAVTVPGATATLGLSMMMAHYAQTSPDNVWVSQVHSLSFVLDPNLMTANPACNGSATVITLGDDASALQTTGFPFQFYGQTYSDLFVVSNGYVTFGTSDTDFTPTTSEFQNNAPRIAMWWDDLNPSQGGQISFYTDNAAFFEVCFANVPEYFNTGGVSMKLTYTFAPGSGGIASLDYGPMSATIGLVGMSPGNGLGTLRPLNLSIGPTVIAPMEAPYQEFTASDPNDLSGYQLNFAVDGLGFPITQF